jgi:predicted AAA+ superfamily ATPase
MSYLPRVVDVELDARLAAAGAVVIEGPKACGKTSTAARRAASRVLLDVDEGARRAMEVDPSLVLEGARPRLLDEWQVEPRLWNHVRRAVDATSGPGSFILTGSAVPEDAVDRHTGAGRFSFLRMRTMALFESGHSSAAVSLGDLFAGAEARAGDPGLDLDGVIECIVRGGWPAQQGSRVSVAAQAARDYLEQVRTVDISRVGDRRRGPERVGRLLRSLARNVATEVRTSTLAADAGGADGPLSTVTVRDYLDALTRLMVLEDQHAWSPHLRSRAVLRSAPRRHFVDPSLAVAALGASPQALKADLELLGLLFESLVVRDLRVLCQPLDGEVRHYRDHYGNEVDAIVQLRDGRWGALEIKLGVGAVDAAVSSLHRMVANLDLDRVGEPSFLAVVTATGFAYRREDGVDVIPVGALSP